MSAHWAAGLVEEWGQMPQAMHAVVVKVALCTHLQPLARESKIHSHNQAEIEWTPRTGCCWIDVSVGAADQLQGSRKGCAFSLHAESCISLFTVSQAIRPYPRPLFPLLLISLFLRIRIILYMIKKPFNTYNHLFLMEYFLVLAVFWNEVLLNFRLKWHSQQGSLCYWSTLV